MTIMYGNISNISNISNLVNRIKNNSDSPREILESIRSEIFILLEKYSDEQSDDWNSVLFLLECAIGLGLNNVINNVSPILSDGQLKFLETSIEYISSQNLNSTVIKFLLREFYAAKFNLWDFEIEYENKYIKKTERRILNLADAEDANISYESDLDFSYF